MDKGPLYHEICYMRVRYKWGRLYCICVHSTITCMVFIMSGIICIWGGGGGGSGGGWVEQERNAC